MFDFRYVRHFALCLAACLAGFSGGNLPRAQGQTPAPGPQQLELDKLLKEAKWKRQEALKARFEPVLRDLSRNSATEFRNLYLDAIYAQKFSGDPREEKAFQEWQKDNKELLADPRLGICTQIAALNIQGHIYLVLGEKDKAAACFLGVLNQIAAAPNDVAGFHLMREKLEDALLLKYYNISLEYFKGNPDSLGPISEVEALFLGGVLPWYEKNHPDKLANAWDSMINAAGKVASLNELALEKFNISECPRMLLAEADYLFKLGNKERAVQALKTLIQRFPESTNFDEAAQKLTEFGRS